jgi:hypothetical protein
MTDHIPSPTDDWVLFYFCSQGEHELCGRIVGTTIRCCCKCHEERG